MRFEETALRLTLCAASLAALCLAAAGCNRGPVVRSPVAACTATLPGEVCDPQGDARPDRRLRHHPPDLVHGTAEIRGGNLVFTVRLAPGTFDPATTLILIYLDADQSRSTGITMAGGLGVDYNITLSTPNGGHVEKYDGRWLPLGSVSTTVAADGMDVTVPLALIGNPRGGVIYRVSSFIVLPNAAAATGVIVDSMPDISLPPGRVP